MRYLNILVISILANSLACTENSDKDVSTDSESKTEMVKIISDEAKVIRNYVIKNAVIAHRGTT